MKRHLVISFVLISIISLLPAICQAQSYYYSVEGLLRDPDYPDGNNPVTYNLTGLMIIQESPTPADGFEQIINQFPQSLYDTFTIKAAVLMSDLEVFKDDGKIFIDLDYDTLIPGGYFNVSSFELGELGTGHIVTYADFVLTFRNENGQSLPIEMFDTLPVQIDIREAFYETDACRYCDITNMTLKRMSIVEPLPTPDLDLDGDVDGNDLSIFSKLFGVTTLENLSPPMPIYPYWGGGTLDNGCSDNSNPIEWEFGWSTITNATKYNLYVIGPNSSVPLVDQIVTTNSYQYVNYGFIEEENYWPWKWKVRSGNDQGQWSVWSLPRSFSVEPVNTDCQ